MHFNRILYGTQYYRTPTPLPSEWEEDIPRLADYALDTLQIRINWRWNEVREGEYNFDDVDRLFELAEASGRKVIVKFLLECAPQYVFDKYGGTRIGPRGEKLRGGSHGAFYGGWRPCFTNPDVARRAALFCEEVAKRYKDRDSLILWNAWNEIRNKPFEDCFCDHCRAEYGRYLKKKFGTVEALNAFYGTAEDSFETIALPSSPHGFWDTYEFKYFRSGDNLYDYLRIVYDAVRKHDKVRPIMAHVGVTSAFQTILGDVSNDYVVKEAVDFWGTSIPCECKMETPDERLDFMMLNDYLRSLDKNYFVHEIYPGLGMFKYSYDTPFDMRFKLYTALSSGAKGLVFWQYRAERVGHENDCAGIVRADGSPREVAFTVGDFGRELEGNSELIAGSTVKRAEAAIVYDFSSALLSMTEDACGPDFHFETTANALQYYQKSHTGAYRLMRECDYDVDYVGACYPERFKDYKLLYFPYYNMFNENITEALCDFVKGGGVVIADEGFGLREMNTWMNPYDIPVKPAATARMRERRRNEDFELTYKGRTIKAAPFKTEYAVKDAEVIASFPDGTPAIQRAAYGKGFIYFLGFPMGYSAHGCREGALTELLCDIMTVAGIEKTPLSDFKDGIYVKELSSERGKIFFVFNCSPEKKEILIGNAEKLGGEGELTESGVTLGSSEMGYYLIKE